MVDISNPIIPGFYPDPSIIRVGQDFYLVNSSFEYFPAIPIWHSRDLVHWRQIGNVVTEKRQNLDLSRVRPSGGVQAATIRHHKGTFYVTSTRVNPEWPHPKYHFVVTAENIEGPWSECHFIDDAFGIDSSLFFDEDEDKCYFLANRLKENAKNETDTEIWISEIDLDTYQLRGEKVVLWDGTGGIFPEGPRLYKRNGYYYLLIAEGGTLHFHTTTIARSESVLGPYTPSPRNPILTHKNLGREYPVQNVGHADLVQLANGEWWGVALGSRPRGGFYDGGNVKYSFGGYYRNLGRETFIFPVTWPADDLSPLFAPETGRVEMSYEAPNLQPAPLDDVPIDFSEESLNIKWLTIRNEDAKHISRESPDALTLQLQPSYEVTWFGTRQTSWKFHCSVKVDFSRMVHGDRFAVTAYIREGHFLALEVSKANVLEIECFASSGLQARAIASTELTILTLDLSGSDQDYTFSIPETGFVHTLDGREISCDMTDSHTGVMIAFTGSSLHESPIGLSNFSYRVM